MTPDHLCQLAKIIGGRLETEYNQTSWNITPQALQKLEDSYVKETRETQKTAVTLGVEQLSWPDPKHLTERHLTEGFPYELSMKLIILNNAIRDITLFRAFVLSMLQRTDNDDCSPEGSKGLETNNWENTIQVCKSTQEQYLSHQLEKFQVDASPKSSPLLENVVTRSPDYSASDYHNLDQAAGSVTRSLPHDTSEPPSPEPTDVNVIKWTAINLEERRGVTKGVPCPIKSCSRNSRTPPKYFARADNLGGHLRKVHGIHIPSRARVRHWVTGNKSQVLLQAAEVKTRELQELGILGSDGTWERPGV